ncbi:nucleoside hydrolase [Corynebacterium sp. CCUG 18816]|uniref:nucleoside hydrolase n=1 Tax=Corynebacterium pseudogenitalium TaxID=38303 RepID=UPI00210BDAFA|nr:nucleoside hydrolase [Corynebacterium pseudogenitalium]
MRIIVDCVPGVEDTLALAYVVAAHHHGRAELECVTTSSGSASAAQCAQHAAWVLARCGLPAVAVAAGCDVPKHQPTRDAGLGDAQVPDRYVANDWDLLWADACARGTRDLCLICTGPLTNLAEFSRRYPEYFDALEHIVVSESSLLLDREASDVVLQDTPVAITVCTALDTLTPVDTRKCPPLGEIGADRVGSGALFAAQVALGDIEADGQWATLAPAEKDDDPNAFLLDTTGVDAGDVVKLFDACCATYDALARGDGALETARHLRAED